MTDERLRVTTEAQRDRLRMARRTGGLCAACGRTLGDDETVYLERFLLGVKTLRESNVVTYASDAYAPVGSECVSPELLQRTASVEPERCVGCSRGVYSRSERSTRPQVLCSKRCSALAATAKRMARAKAEA